MDTSPKTIRHSRPLKDSSRPPEPEHTPALVCFSHLRWNFVYQRPQHLMSRWAKVTNVFYVEEPKFDAEPSRLAISTDAGGVTVVTPHINTDVPQGEQRDAHRKLISDLFEQYEIIDFIAWYYDPMALAFTDHLHPAVTVFDCMDELSAFKGAPAALKEMEQALIARCDVIFTGGRSLYEARRGRHANVHLFPSSTDAEHFRKARQPQPDPGDQAGIPHPRLGYFGVIDERMDLELIGEIAQARPNWNLVFVGPTAKIDPKKLPSAPNVYYLGMKSYAELPAYLAGWDVALLPFALNASTRYISPTKTPEYLAGGKPVVSTPVLDVVRTYGESGLVRVADTPHSFINAVEAALHEGAGAEWLKAVDALLASNSWDSTWSEMHAQVEKALAHKAPPGASNGGNGNGGHGNGAAHAGLADAPDLAQSAVAPSEKGRRGREVFDYLIVGAGFAGAVLAERLARGAGKKVLLVEKRPHIAGNAYDHYDDAGILIHKYGPHIFHTNSREVFAYLSNFTRWRPYEHRVRASVDGQLLPMPINLDTINRLYGLNLSSFEMDQFFASIAEPKDELLTSEDVVVSKIGRNLYEKFFRNYTRKQWGLDPSELDAQVTARVPVRSNRDDRYFNDAFQAMPLHGYTRMFENLLDHPNISIMLNTEYTEISSYINYEQLIFTGPVDEYFEYCYGRLPYRSLQFQWETRDYEQHQPVAVINYPNEHAYTRVTEFKHLTGQQHPKTTLVYEYPCSDGDPYYPIPRPENAELYKRYKALADSFSKVHFVGRLGTYKYYNMDQVTAQALTLFGKLSGAKRGSEHLAYENSHASIWVPCPLMASQEAS